MKKLSLEKILTYIKVSLPWYTSIPVLLFSVMFPAIFGCDTYQDIGIMLDKSFSIIAVITFSNVWYIELQQKTAEVYKLLPRRSRINDILKRIVVKLLFLTVMICLCFISYSIKGIHVYDSQNAGAMCIQAILSIEAVMILFGAISFFIVNLSSNLGVGIGSGIFVWMIMISTALSKTTAWFNFFAYGVRDDWFKGAITAVIVGTVLFIAGTIVVDKNK
ncbi:MAG: hypothetical protein K6F71_10590 [Ruminococcus sp.]|uniref:hypothetical protein n=1 Tax=Ruminococcus sp. TaxID=41978 RepID=UPI0025DF56F9|nr:hypothetical protein [Ruminococcus sp.]MCR5541243.1 hypothetical protein [Ruminococcus sp.]